MMKYIVCRMGWQYDDQYYSAEEGGIPIKICGSLEEANEYINELTNHDIEHMKEECLSHIYDETAIEICQECFQEDEYPPHEDVTDAQWLKYKELIKANLVLYESWGLEDV